MHSSVGKESACNAGDLGSIPGLGRSAGEGNGNPLQYSCLENPMDRGAWQAAVHGVARIGCDLATKPPPPRQWWRGGRDRQRAVQGSWQRSSWEGVSGIWRSLAWCLVPRKFKKYLWNLTEDNLYQTIYSTIKWNFNPRDDRTSLSWLLGVFKLSPWELHRYT